MTTATANNTRAALETAEEISTQINYATSLLNTFIDQWENLKRAAATDRESNNFYRLTLEFERVSVRVENLLNMTDDLLKDTDGKGQVVIHTLMEGLKNETTEY